ncbi:endothelin-converting enzyme [Edaphobacter aggregans]|uniref:Endothelin-converting enzyme n=1 Tax=Edaphobacter aggregans TaxID=570835 RepID=A0A3R9NXI6_9BACT|nr:M13 family metallopeptidase [Edaphobacter aggregans]RSL16022.1 endothelin-converting enzyme [Edaphobacter aggregans]
MNLIARRLLPIAGSLLLTFSVSATAQTAEKTAAPLAHGIAIANMDTSVRPGDDFYSFANGGFIAHTKLPPDRATIGVFTVLSDLSSERTTSIIQDAAKANAVPGTDQRKIADLYHSYMDEAAIETHGLATLKPHLAEIAAISSPQQLAHALGLSLRADVDALNNTNFHTPNIFGLWVAPSFNDPDHYAPYLLQGGLQLPNRDYYLSTSPRMQEIRTKYQAHIAAMFRLAGISDAEARATRVLTLETAIAKVHISLADSEDIHKANNPWTPADFSTNAPGLNWPEFFRAAGLDKQTTFIVWQPIAFTGEAALVSSQPIDAWKDLLAYHLIEAYAAASSKALADESFAFFGQTLSGTPQQRPRDVRGARLVSGLLGGPVGQIFAQQYFSPEAKAQAEALVSNLIAAFRQRLENLTWMAPATKAEALAKLGTLQVGIGYPDHWRSYAALEVTPDNLFLNLWRSDLFEYHYDVGRIGTTVDRREWTMNPQTVNAVNLPLHNGLNFPAAILQPPFFDPKAPAAVNYGAIGTVIGHEISHTFDSEGAAFDSKGRVRNWWTPEDLAHFNAAAAALAAQYDTYKAFPDLAVNGRQTLGENIADVAGLTAAYDGYHASLNGKPAPMDGNFTGDQQFFIAFAQNWGSVVRDATLRQQILTDPHAPGRFRAATVRNNDAWYPAFDVQPTDKLYIAPKDRVQLW